MFIDVTRHGGVVLLRLSATAIAYISETPTGCVIHLIGGETIRANETRDEIEARVAAMGETAAQRLEQSDHALVDWDPGLAPAPSDPSLCVAPPPSPSAPAEMPARSPHHQNGRKKR